jgi:hypothetical protein
LVLLKNLPLEQFSIPSNPEGCRFIKIKVINKTVPAADGVPNKHKLPYIV